MASKSKKDLDKEFYLPRDEQEFDILVEQVCLAFNLKDKEHATAVISVAIRHLPNEQATTTLRYLGHWILKSIANHVANFKGDKIRHEAQVDQCVNLLTTDPLNNQARDQLEKWANEGSNAARDAVKKINEQRDTSISTDTNVLPIKAV